VKDDLKTSLSLLKSKIEAASKKKGKKSSAKSFYEDVVRENYRNGTSQAKPHYYGEIDGVHVMHATHADHANLIGKHSQVESLHEFHRAVEDASGNGFRTLILHGEAPKELKEHLATLSAAPKQLTKTEHFQRDGKTTFRGDKGKFKKGELSDYRAGDPMLKPGQSYEQLREAEVMKKSSKNKKEKRAEAFGGWHTAPDSDQRKKQMGALEQLGRKRYGLETERSPGKPNAKGKTIDKPHLMTGKLQHIGNPDSLVHEMGHVERAPKGQSLADYQVEMDREWGVQNVKYGFKQQARAKEEYETTALEQPLRRRAGLPAHLKETSNPDPKRDFAVDEPNKKITHEVKLPSGRKAKLTGTSMNRSPEANTRLDQVDRGELKYSADKGWHESHDINGKINRRAREKAKDPSRKDAKTLMRSELKPGETLEDLQKFNLDFEEAQKRMKAAVVAGALAVAPAVHNALPGIKAGMHEHSQLKAAKERSLSQHYKETGTSAHVEGGLRGAAHVNMATGNQGLGLAQESAATAIEDGEKNKAYEQYRQKHAPKETAFRAPKMKKGMSLNDLKKPE
jgi:hypothetical protein